MTGYEQQAMNEPEQNKECLTAWSRYVRMNAWVNKRINQQMTDRLNE